MNTTNSQPPLTPVGLALLLFQGSKDHDARLTVPNRDEDRPGIRCTEGPDGKVLMEAMGWGTKLENMGALWRAVDLCLDLGLATEGVPLGLSIHPARLVYRR